MVCVIDGIELQNYENGSQIQEQSLSSLWCGRLITVVTASAVVLLLASDRNVNLVEKCNLFGVCWLEQCYLENVCEHFLDFSICQLEEVCFV